MDKVGMGSDSGGIRGKFKNWVDENITGKEGPDTADFKDVVQIGVAGGAAVGLGLGALKGIQNMSNAEATENTVTKEILGDKLAGYKRDSYPFTGPEGGYKQVYTPKLLHNEHLGEYETTEVSKPGVLGFFSSALLGAVSGALIGGAVAVGLRVMQKVLAKR